MWLAAAAAAATWLLAVHDAFHISSRLSGVPTSDAAAMLFVLSCLAGLMADAQWWYLPDEIVLCLLGFAFLAAGWSLPAALGLTLAVFVAANLSAFVQGLLTGRLALTPNDAAILTLPLIVFDTGTAALGYGVCAVFLGLMLFWRPAPPAGLRDALDLSARRCEDHGCEKQPETSVGRRTGAGDSEPGNHAVVPLGLPVLGAILVTILWLLWVNAPIETAMTPAASLLP